MKKISNVFQISLIFLGIIAIILFLLPKLIGISPSVVLSGSMEDELKVGSIAYSNTHVKVEDIKVGDVIVFQIDKSYVTHRVVKINNDNTFTTKGDANENEDLAPVKFENYKGKIIFSIPYIGYLVQAIRTRLGYLIILIIIGINIAIDIISNKNNRKKDT